MICENSYAESDTKNLESFMNIKELNEAIDKALCEKVEYINEWSIYYIDDVEPDECFEEDEAGAWQRFEEVKDKVAQLVKKTYKIDGNEMDTVAEDVLYDYRDKSESVKQTKSTKKSIKEEMEYNRKIWDLFEENIAEYLNEHGVKPEGNNVMNYISENAAEIVKAVLNKNYNYEEDDHVIFELYYNCPINITDKAQAIDKLLEEYLAESLKRCLTIEDKLLQISSLDKNESVTDKKSMKEEKESFETVLIDDRYLIYPDGVVYDTDEAEDIPSYVFKIRDKIIG